ncbi:MAG: hypothetical protein QE284_20200 [Rhizobium sp.]|nr:hypothetical protein [Rhizobium sp.]
MELVLLRSAAFAAMETLEGRLKVRAIATAAVGIGYPALPRGPSAGRLLDSGLVIVQQASTTIPLCPALPNVTARL